MSTRTRRVLLTVAAVPLAAILTFGALITAWLNGWRIPAASGTTWFSVTNTSSVTHGSASHRNEPSAPFFVLVLGSDYRPGVEGGRADGIHVVGVNPKTAQATIVNIPRDTTIAIPGRQRNKVNATTALGGPKLAAQAIGALMGIDLRYAVMTDFAGFVGLVDTVGGVDVPVLRSMHDKFSGTNFDPGIVHMNGHQALAFSRDRYSFANGDYSRTMNQATLLISALAKFRAQHTGAAGTIEGLAILGRHTEVEGIGMRDLYELGRAALDINPAVVRSVLLPMGAGSGSGPAPRADIEGFLADFRDDAVLQNH